MELPEWIDEEIWSEWIAYRREDKKKPASERSQRMTLTKLAKLHAQGYDVNGLIQHAIELEWQGVYAVDEYKLENSRTGSGSSHARPSAVERVRAANAAAFRPLGANDGIVRDEMDESARGDALRLVVSRAG